jgi:dimeric dUTPase (all-alpha-NTP-PPase superfamily)
VTAVVQELAELREEFSWKPWATDKPFANRERILEEAVDAAHFLGNILIGLGISDNEWEQAYRQKQEMNRRRAASGTYSAKKGGLAMGSDNE